MAAKTVKTKKVVKKTVVKKTVVKKPVVKKAKATTGKVVTAPKGGSAKKVSGATKPAAKVVVKPAVKTAGKLPPAKKVTAPQVKVKSQVDKKSLAILKDALIKMRDRLTGQITALSDDSLKYIDDASSEDRTDDFDREFALNLVSSEHDSVFEINSALRRIEDGVYGVCDSCSCQVEKPRLHALPFARMCVKCQSEQEKGRSRFRPFGESLAQGVEQAAEVVEAEETE